VYFTHVGPNLAAKIPCVSGSYLDYKTGIDVAKTMYIQPTTSYEIYDIILQLDCNKVLDMTAILPRLLELLVNLLVNH